MERPGRRECEEEALMLLRDKGPVRPRPTLAGPLEAVAAEVESWTGVVAAAHWDLHDPERVDGVDFYVGDRELGHLHLSGEAHLATARAIGPHLVRRGLAEPFRHGGHPTYAGWVQRAVRGDADVAPTVAILRLNHRLATGWSTMEALGELQRNASDEWSPCVREHGPQDGRSPIAVAGGGPRRHR